MRVPRINKQHSALEGFPPPPQESAPLNQFYIGEDVFLEGYLEVEDTPVNIDDWEPTLILKTNANSSQTLWEGILNNGLEMSKAKPGFYKILIPAEIFTVQAPGTFWIDFFLKEQLGRFNNNRDRRVLAARLPFTMSMSGIATSVIDSRQQAERTYPFAVNIMKA